MQAERRAAEAGRARRVLIVRLDALGDFLLWLPAAQALREHYASARITLLANPAWADFARELPLWDRVWSLDRTRYLQEGLYRRLRRARIQLARFDIVIQPTYSRYLSMDDGVIRRSGAPERIGSVGDTSNQTPAELALSARAYTRLLPAAAGPMNELDRNAEFVAQLTGSAAALRVPSLAAAADAGVPPPARPYFVVAPGANWPARRWPADRFAAAVDRVAQRHGLLPVVVGDARDAAYARALAAAVKTPLDDRVGRTRVVDLASLIRSARFVLAAESGPAHLAALLRVPGVVILGGGHHGRFLPYPEAWHGRLTAPRIADVRLPCFGCNWSCIHPLEGEGTVRCVARVSVDAVVGEVDRLLAG